MVTYYVRAYHELNYTRKVCATEECLRSASNLKLSIDETIDPCDDFYEFSCNHWSDEHPNHGWYPKFSTFETIDERVSIATLNFLNTNASSSEPKPVKQSRDLFKSCLDVDSTDNLGYTVIINVLKELGLPPVPNYFRTEDKNKDFNFDWIKMSVNLKKVFDMNIFIQFDVDADLFNRSNNVMYVGSGISGSPLPSPFKTKKQNRLKDKLKRSQKDDEDDESKAAILEEASKKAIKQIFKVVLENVTTVPEESALDEAVNIVWNMTNEIAEMADANVTDIDELDLRHYKIDELQTITNNFLKAKNIQEFDVWKPYLEYLFTDIDTTFDYKNDVLFVSLPETDYLNNIVLYLAKTPKLNLELYAWWTVVKSMIMSTTSEIGEFIYKTMQMFYRNPPEVSRSRSLECAQLVTGFMGIAVSYGIADTTFMNNTMPKVEQMLHGIKEAFIQRVNGISWMDKPTKLATLEKAENMISFIGFPEWLLNNTAIGIYYSNITISPTRFLENMMQFVRKSSINTITSFGKMNEKTWRTDPTTVNAYNYFGDNSIIVPMAILTFPIYHLGLEVLNYGAIGSILGHELTHGFDNFGRKYDKEGNYVQWWTNETIETFENKTECFVSQYNAYKVPSIDMHVDGELTLGENLADNGGLHHAYLAYQNYLKREGEEPHLPGFEKYTPSQMFFIAYGSIWCEIRDDELTAEQIQSDEHSPGKFRVMGSLQNSHEFSEAFSCPIGSNMNPSRTRCRIW